MRGHLAAILCLVLSVAGCVSGAVKTAAPVAATPERVAASSASSGTNVFNPYMNAALPNTRRLSDAGEQMLRQMGASAHRIEGEAAYRQHWREELYPVVFGDARAPHELLVLLDFAEPRSEKIWRTVAEAARFLPPTQAKIVVFANSGENYGTDLMGFAIWLSYSRPGEAMPWIGRALAGWNAVKAEQMRVRGRVVPFNNEYDATARPSDYPMLYTYMEKLRPPVSSGEELALSKYCYDAGNVNLYQAMQVSTYYGVKSLPAVIVDGKPLASPSAGAIVEALK
ncbi:MAG: hypothetical protein LBB66_04955 [Desulfovibrio sp.]|jgi:hypothetical protein|nr:hypothetical protein [Desulfovibrio sp.]